MKRPSDITTVESKIAVPVNLLEEHVNSKHHPREAAAANGYLHDVHSKDFENLLWCSEELELDGMVEIHMELPDNWQRCISIPVTTAFFVVCTKGAGPIYRLTWSSSLS